MPVTDLDRLADALAQEPRGDSLPPPAMSLEEYFEWVCTHWQSLTPEAREREHQRAAAQRVRVAFEYGDQEPGERED